MRRYITKQAATLSLSLCTFELLARQIIRGEFNNQTLTLTQKKKNERCVYMQPRYTLYLCVCLYTCANLTETDDDRPELLLMNPQNNLKNQG